MEITMNSLEQKYTEAKAEWGTIEGSPVPVFFVGAATCGRAAGADEVLKALRDELAGKGIEAKVLEVGCLGPCYLEPLVIVHKPGAPRICYGNVTPESVGQLWGLAWRARAAAKILSNKSILEAELV